ncbi:hypothetical protein LINPERHAP1_LOCUS4690 [Linum perenne]
MSLEPTAVVVEEENVKLSGRNLVSRHRLEFNYFWILFDAVEAFLPAGEQAKELWAVFKLITEVILLGPIGNKEV